MNGPEINVFHISAVSGHSRLELLSTFDGSQTKGVWTNTCGGLKG